MEDKAHLIIAAANIICGEVAWSLLIKTAFGRFNQLVILKEGSGEDFVVINTEQNVDNNQVIIIVMFVTILGMAVTCRNLTM